MNESSGWSARERHNSVALPDGNIMLMAGDANVNGITGSERNDTWLSRDNGATWTLLNASSGWLPRYGARSTLTSDGHVLIIGGDQLRDVWSFNPVGSTAQIPSHVYSTAGMYSVALLVHSATETNSTLKGGYINVSPPVTAPVAGFSANVTFGIAPLAVNFTDSSSNKPTSWNWSYQNVTGNNTQIWWTTEQNPSLVFGVGNWSIKLNATNSAGSNISTQQTFINVSASTITPFVASKIGVFRNSHDWLLDYNGNGTWDGGSVDKQFTLGKVGDLPVTGDWNGNGITEIGVFRDNHTWNVDFNGNGVWDGPAGGDRIYITGKPGDIPVPGDWNGDNTTEMAVFRGDHTWYIDYNGNGVWDGPAGGDRIYITGKPGDIPVPGDWNGDNITEMGVFRDNHTWYIDYNGNGVWDGPSGGDRIYTTGQPGDIPVFGDWNGDRLCEMGVFRPSNHQFYLDFNANGIWDGASVDKRYDFGTFGDIPVSGKW